MSEAKENQIAAVLQNLMVTQYALDKKDQERIVRLVKYSQEKQGLTLEEKKILIERGVMDKADERLIPGPEFIFRGIITPSFWFKCLLVLDELMDFSGEQSAPSS